MSVSNTSRFLIFLFAMVGLVGSACAATEDATVASRLEDADAAGEQADADEIRQQVQDEEEAQAQADAEANALIDVSDSDVDECDVGECTESEDALDSECAEGSCSEVDETPPFADGCANVLHEPVADIPDSLSQIVLNLGSDLPDGATVSADVDGSLDVIAGVVTNGAATVVAGIDHYGDYVVSSVSIDGQTVDFDPELANLTVTEAEGTIAGACAVR